MYQIENKKMVNKKERKGIILAGGNGTRLSPITKAISKQLLPIYDKPMIYYPLSTLLIAGIKEILIICSPLYLESYKRLLKDGKQLGISIKYLCQNKPEGIAHAFVLGEKFLGGHPVCLILGDNLFYGDDLSKKLSEANEAYGKNTLFAYQVKDPSRYGIIDFKNEEEIISIEEKPAFTSSNFAITGIYFYENSVIQLVKNINPSQRGELEITDINKELLRKKNLSVKLLRRGMAWLDTGTFDSLHDAGSFIKTIENRQGLKIGCLEEIAWKKRYIDDKKLKKQAEQYLNSSYGEYLLNLLE